MKYSIAMGEGPFIQSFDDVLPALEGMRSLGPGARLYLTEGRVELARVTTPWTAAQRKMRKAS